MFSDEQNKALSAKLDPAHISTRRQSGKILSYIEGWHAISEANRIFGFDGWSRETIEMRCVAETPYKIGGGQKDGWNVAYIAKVRVCVGAVVREGSGAGHGIDANIGIAHESALKEAETDAMKRALMTFGHPFGLALYDKERAHVGTDEDATREEEGRGRSREEWIAESRDLAEIANKQKDVAALTSLWQSARCKAFREGAPEDLGLALTNIFGSCKRALNPAQKEYA